MDFVGFVPTWMQWLVVVVAVAGLLFKAADYARRFVAWVRAAAHTVDETRDSVVAMSRLINAELRPNGGGTLTDKVGRIPEIERAILEMAGSVVEIRADQKKRVEQGDAMYLASSNRIDGIDKHMQVLEGNQAQMQLDITEIKDRQAWGDAIGPLIMALLPTEIRVAIEQVVSQHPRPRINPPAEPKA